MPKLVRALSATIVLAGFSVPGGSALADEPKLSPMLKSSTSIETATPETGALRVVMDFAKILSLEGAAKTVVIGNPGILDATVSDERTIVLTGKAAGTTNMIVLGENRHEILNTNVSVVPSRTVTTVFQGMQRQTYSCVGACTPVVSVGDEPQHFDRARTQTQARQDFATGTAQ